MAHYFFHCSGGQEVLVDHNGDEVENLTEARDRAFRVVSWLAATPGGQDWRNWTVHVSNDDGVEVLQVPFALVLGRAH
jgi:Domain of unknown function (DUF6894)